MQTQICAPFSSFATLWGGRKVAVYLHEAKWGRNWLTEPSAKTVASGACPGPQDQYVLCPDSTGGKPAFADRSPR